MFSSVIKVTAFPSLFAMLDSLLLVRLSKWATPFFLLLFPSSFRVYLYVFFLPVNRLTFIRAVYYLPYIIYARITFHSFELLFNITRVIITPKVYSCRMYSSLQLKYSVLANEKFIFLIAFLLHFIFFIDFLLVGVAEFRIAACWKAHNLQLVCRHFQDSFLFSKLPTSAPGPTQTPFHCLRSLKQLGCRADIFQR